MIIISKYDPLWKWINKNKTDDFKLILLKLKTLPERQ